MSVVRYRASVSLPIASHRSVSHQSLLSNLSRGSPLPPISAVTENPSPSHRRNRSDGSHRHGQAAQCSG